MSPAYHELDPELCMMDIMLLDQVFRGRIKQGARIADLGSGGGRNIRWFVKQGHAVSATDHNASLLEQLPAAVHAVEAVLPETKLEAGAFDLVLLNAVLHFAPDHDSFRSWIAAAVDLLALNGLLFIRCASQIAWPGVLPCDEFGVVKQAGCPFTFLPSRRQLMDIIAEHRLQLKDPIKTSVVDQQRCMSTIVLRRVE